MNSWVNSINFLTCWFTATQAADLISFNLFISPNAIFTCVCFSHSTFLVILFYFFFVGPQRLWELVFPCVSLLSQEDYYHLDACVQLKAGTTQRPFVSSCDAVSFQMPMHSEEQGLHRGFLPYFVQKLILLSRWHLHLWVFKLCLSILSGPITTPQLL